MRAAPTGPVSDILNRLDKVKPTAGGWIARCPAHDDREPSLSISEGNDGRVLLHCHAGCNIDSITSAIRVEPTALFPPADNGNGKTIVATYDYVDERGQLLYQAVRYQPKTFRQRRPDGNGGWNYSLGDTRRVLYRLPAILDAVQQGATIYICEGEKDVHAIEQAGAAATTNAMGAGKWRDDYSVTLTGARQVVIVADNDDAGRQHAQAVADSLTRHNIPATIKQPAEGKDAHDHLSAGHTLEQLVTPNNTTGTWQPVDLNDDRYAIPPTPPDLHPLIYSGLRHAISGPPEATKTLLSYAILLDIVRNGHTVAIVDFEMGANAARILLDDLGATADERRQIIYYQDVEGPPTDADLTHLEQRQVVAVLIDSSVGAFDASGLDDNARKDVEAWAKAWIRPLFNRGITTITLDHVTKNADTRGKFTIGSERKVGGVDVHLGAEPVGSALRRGGKALVKIRTHKDRRGFLNRPYAYAVDIVSDPATHGLTIALRADDNTDDQGRFRPTKLMDKVSRYLEHAGHAVSLNSIEQNVNGNARYKRAAVDALVEDGYAIETRGPRDARMIESCRQYRHQEPPRPTSSDLVQDEVPRPRPTSSPSTEGTRRGDAPETTSSSSTPDEWDQAEIARLEELARTYGIEDDE